MVDMILRSVLVFCSRQIMNGGRKSLGMCNPGDYNDEKNRTKAEDARRPKTISHITQGLDRTTFDWLSTN